jgi:hypothetical protein
VLNEFDMGELKTKPKKVTVESFLAKIPDETVPKDCCTLIKLLEKATGEKAKM